MMPESIVHNEDCLAAMRLMPDNAFGLLEADPPYFSGPDRRKYYGPVVNKLNIRRTDYPVTSTWSLPDSVWFSEARRVSENQIIWGANYFDFIGIPHKTPRRAELTEWLLQHPRGWIVWDKVNYDSSFNDFELAWTSFDRPTVVFKYMWNGMLQGKSISEGHLMQGNKKRNEKRIHPTQKPINLYRWEFTEYGYPGIKIISTHVGSGSARLAAYDLGYDFIGFETDATHFEAQENRFALSIQQQSLFQ